MMVVKFGTQQDCPHRRQSFRMSPESCPNCGSTDVRVDVNESAKVCPNCRKLNLTCSRECWNCDEPIDRGLKLR